MAHCLIGLGANLGDPAAQLDQVCDSLCRRPHLTCVARSRYYATAPVGGPAGQPAYLNAALRIATSLGPHEVLAAAREIEQQLGRARRVRWGPRTIDIDLLLYDALTLETDTLVLPHPRMAMRRFVLEPACEVAADMLHPPTGWTIGELWQRLAEPPYYVAIAGAEPLLRARLAAQVAHETRSQWCRDPAPPPTTPAAGVQSATATARAWGGHERAAIAARLAQLQQLPTARLGSPWTWSVCDYWLPQSLAAARAARDDAVRHEVETACWLAMHQVPPPKCVLLLTGAAPLAEAADRGGRDALEGNAAHAAALADELNRVAALPRQSPVLQVPWNDPALAVTELAAAMDAMR